MHSFHPFKRTVSRGIALLEVLMVVAIVSSLSAGAVLVLSEVTKTARATKLQRDVVVINNAICTYLLSGGTFLRSELSNPAAVLKKLKKRASDDSAKEIAGLRGSMADARLTFEMQTPSEAEKGEERARFISDPLNPRFVIQSGGPPGIQRFVLDSNLAGQDFGTEERKVTLKLAKKDPWVWDYSDSPNRRGEPKVPPATDPDVGNPILQDAGNLPLNPPGFSLPSGSAPLTLYPRSLALLPTNPSGSAEILYSLDGSPFLKYAGPFNVDPGMTVSAISVSLDVDHYDDSPAASRTYTTVPHTLVPQVVFSKSMYTYFDLGGLADPGTPPPSPSGTVSGTGTILNVAEIPVAYQNSEVFRLVWTLDGSAPLTSGTAMQQPEFAGGFPDVQIAVPLTAFGTTTSVTVRSQVKTMNAAIVTDSTVVTSTLLAQLIELRKPLMTIKGRDVTLALDVSGRDMPMGARIYYTIDNTDPGMDAYGNPLRGTLYRGVPFLLHGATGSTRDVRARVYPPVDFRQFFIGSNEERQTVILPPKTWVYVGGRFVNSSGNPMRNLARLKRSGEVDGRFDTGAGASAGSLVGIVLESRERVLAGGDFQTMGGSARPGLVRLNEDGSVDATFNAGLGAGAGGSP